MELSQKRHELDVFEIAELMQEEIDNLEKKELEQAHKDLEEQLAKKARLEEERKSCIFSWSLQTEETRRFRRRLQEEEEKEKNRACDFTKVRNQIHAINDAIRKSRLRIATLTPTNDPEEEKVTIVKKKEKEAKPEVVASTVPEEIIDDDAKEFTYEPVERCTETNKILKKNK